MDFKSTPGLFIEWFFRTWVQLFGKRVRRNEALWLDGPMGGVDRVGANFFQTLSQQSDLAGSHQRAGFRLNEGLSKPRREVL